MKTYPTEIWVKFLKDIKKRITEGDIENFLSWPSIRQSMSTEDEPNISILDLAEKQFQFSEFNNIFEFGGGHGRICRMIFDRGFTGKYTIFDFPEMAELQKFYLKNIKVDFLNDFDSIVKPIGKSLFISMSAIEETPREIKEMVFQIGNDYDCFLFKFSGGVSSFEDFENKVKGTWINKILTPSVYLKIGKKKPYGT